MELFLVTFSPLCYREKPHTVHSVREKINNGALLSNLKHRNPLFKKNTAFNLHSLNNGQYFFVNKSIGDITIHNSMDRR